ncbi:CYTH domain-containing protein [Pseudaquabacterium rugosum]|uniref:CYTH domain-containing protein n=1 Tax=Pseudaquabacterium rugosum TaxID=2984194 RepID=A0ABU9B6Q7_9BURK
MSIELELKFRLPAGALERVRAALQAGDLAGACGPAAVLRLAACYLDTADRALARARAALRVRLEGEVWVQTLKAEGALPLERLEHEVRLDAPADGPVPAVDPARHDGHPAGARLRAVLGGGAAAGGAAALPPLRERYRTDVRRTLRTLRHQGATIELALDEGWLSAADGQRRAPIEELEFELKDGPVAALLDLCAQWAEAHGLWLDVRSKSERGHLLAEGLAHSPPPALPAAGAPLAAWLRPLLACASVLADGAAAGHHAVWAQAWITAAQGPAVDALQPLRAALESVSSVPGVATEIAPAAAADPSTLARALRAPQVQRAWLALLGAAAARTPD